MRLSGVGTRRVHFLGMLCVPLILSLAPQDAVASLLRHILSLGIPRIRKVKNVTIRCVNFLGILTLQIISALGSCCWHAAFSYDFVL